MIKEITSGPRKDRHILANRETVMMSSWLLLLDTGAEMLGRLTGDML